MTDGQTIDITDDLKAMVDDPLLGSESEQRILPPLPFTRDQAIRNFIAVCPEHRDELMAKLADAEATDMPVMVRHFVDQGPVMEPIMEEVMIKSADGREIPAVFETGEYRVQTTVNPDTGVTEPTGARYRAFLHNTIEWMEEDELLRAREAQGQG